MQFLNGASQIPTSDPPSPSLITRKVFVFSKHRDSLKLRVRSLKLNFVEPQHLFLSLLLKHLMLFEQSSLERFQAPCPVVIN